MSEKLCRVLGELDGFFDSLVLCFSALGVGGQDVIFDRIRNLALTAPRAVDLNPETEACSLIVSLQFQSIIISN